VSGPQIKIDSTINLPIIGTLLIAVAAGSMWVSTVNNRLDEMSKLIVSVANVSARLDRLQADVLANQAMIQHNRKVLDEGAQ